MSGENQDQRPDGEEEIDAKTEKYLQELYAEKERLGPNDSHASRLLQDEIDKTMESGKVKIEPRYLDVYHERFTKVATRVAVPSKEHPKFNFVGKLLGPQGNTLKRLQLETQCKMAVLGRGSMKDRSKEEELRQSHDPKFAHLSEDLHVVVCAVAPPAEAYARVAYALAELRKYLTPDSNDDIALQQQREMETFLNSTNSGKQDQSMDLNTSLNDDLKDGFNDDDDTLRFGMMRRNRPAAFPRNPPLRGNSMSRGGPPRGGPASRGIGAPGRGAPAPFRGIAARGARGSPRGKSFITREYPAMQDRPAPRGGIGARGRGAPRGRGAGGGLGGMRRDADQDQYYNANSGGNNGRGYQNDGNSGIGGGNSYESDFQRRSNNYGNDMYDQQDSGRGQWKPRGGIGRFVDRNLPYSRRT